MGSIDLPERRRLLSAGTQLIEVRPAAEDAEMHRPGAVNIPLTTLDAPTTASLDRDRPAHPADLHRHAIGRFARR
ncbi:rhodanese-like domain-containing protein [Pseudonocardia sp. GCM10023141]